MPKRRDEARCCPNMDARSITREEHEDARQVARDIAKTRQYEISMKLRKKVEMLFAHLKRILRFDFYPAVFDYVVHVAQMTNSTSPQPPKTFGSWRRSFLHRRNHEQPDKKGVRRPIQPLFSAPATRCFSTE